MMSMTEVLGGEGVRILQTKNGTAHIHCAGDGPICHTSGISYRDAKKYDPDRADLDGFDFCSNCKERCERQERLEDRRREAAKKGRRKQRQKRQESPRPARRDHATEQDQDGSEGAVQIDDLAGVIAGRMTLQVDPDSMEVVGVKDVEGIDEGEVA